MRDDILARSRALLEADGCDADAICAAEAVLRSMGDGDAMARAASRDWVSLPSAEVAETVAHGTLQGPEHSAVVIRTTDADGMVRTFLAVTAEEDKA